MLSSLTRPGQGVAARQSSHPLRRPFAHAPWRGNRATTGDADLPFARTAHSAGLRPGVTVVPVSAGSDLMCVWPEPVDSSKDIVVVAGTS